LTTARPTTPEAPVTMTVIAPKATRPRGVHVRRRQRRICNPPRCTCNTLLDCSAVEQAIDYEDVLDQLRARGLRMTPQRRAIVSEVMRTAGHISPAAIARRVQGDMPGVNASTVYRTLTLLEDIGVLQHSHLETGAEYHRTDEARHVHLTCHRCGRDDALSIAEADRLGALIHRHHGFVADLTHFAITGLCAECAVAV
jgi:Fur family ferric uptake transcriptional regulator